jgi:branched-chain amino acid transport system permease protein
LGFAVSLPVVGVVGILVYELAYRPILHKPPYVALIASIGIFIAAEELFRIVFGPYGISYAEPHLDGIVPLGGGIAIKTAELATLGGATVAIAILWLLATRTRTGIAWRATVTDPAMAESFGISVRRVRYLNFFVGSALAAAGGIMVGLLNNLVEPGMGAVPSYKALAIIVLGGLGSIPGALVASIALGVIESFGTIYLSGVLDRDAIAFAFLIAVLMLRPHGLFARG